MAGRLVLAAVVLALLLPAAPAGATSCPVPAPLPRLQAADAAIIGEALGTQRRRRDPLRGPRADQGPGRRGRRAPGRRGRPSDEQRSRVPRARDHHRPVPRAATHGGWHARRTATRSLRRALRDAARADRAGQRCHLPSVGAAAVVQAGPAVRLVVRVLDPDGRPDQVAVSFGDGVSERRWVTPRGQHSGLAAFGHRFRQGSPYVVTLRAFARPARCAGRSRTPRGGSSRSPSTEPRSARAARPGRPPRAARRRPRRARALAVAARADRRARRS